MASAYLIKQRVGVTPRLAAHVQFHFGTFDRHALMRAGQVNHEKRPTQCSRQTGRKLVAKPLIEIRPAKGRRRRSSNRNQQLSEAFAATNMTSKVPCNSGSSMTCNHQPTRIPRPERYFSEKVLMGNADKGTAIKLNYALHKILKAEINPAAVGRTQKNPCRASRGLFLKD